MTSRDVKDSRKAEAGSIMALVIAAAIMGCHPAAGGYSAINGDLVIAGKDVTWTVKNNDSNAITIRNVSLKWPVQNGRLQRIALDNTNILDKERDPPRTAIDGDLPGQQKKYSLNPGQTSTFKLTFQNPASSIASDYDIDVDFCSDAAEYPLPQSAGCSIIGPDIVCETEDTWLNASLNELPSHGYTYNWKVDGSIAGTGKSIQIEWRSSEAGMHNVSLNVTETSGAATYHNQTSKQVRVVKKPIVKITVQYQQ